MELRVNVTFNFKIEWLSVSLDIRSIYQFSSNRVLISQSIFL